METKNKISPLKGKNYEEILGIEKAKEKRKKSSIIMKMLWKEKKIIPWNKGTKGLTAG